MVLCLPMLVRPFDKKDTEDVVRLWRDCGLTRPWNDPYADIQRKLKAQPDWFLVGLIDARLIASVMVGYDGHRGWINYLAIDTEYRRQGLGNRLMVEAERRLLAVGCPKINLQIRLDNVEAIEFYRSIGFVPDKAVSYGKRLIRDEGSNQ